MALSLVEWIQASGLNPHMLVDGRWPDQYVQLVHWLRRGAPLAQALEANRISRRSFFRVFGNLRQAAGSNNSFAMLRSVVRETSPARKGSRPAYSSALPLEAASQLEKTLLRLYKVRLAHRRPAARSAYSVHIARELGQKYGVKLTPAMIRSHFHRRRRSRPASDSRPA